MPRRSARDNTQAEVRKAARGNVPGFMGMAELAKLARTPGLPSTWHDVRCPTSGQVLYWRREHSGYEVHPVGAMGRDGHTTRYQVELEGKLIGEPHDTLTHAIVSARDQMHASQLQADHSSKNSPTAL